MNTIPCSQLSRNQSECQGCRNWTQTVGIIATLSSIIMPFAPLSMDTAPRAQLPVRYVVNVWKPVTALTPLSNVSLPTPEISSPVQRSAIALQQPARQLPKAIPYEDTFDYSIYEEW